LIPKGTKLSPETRAKISASLTGRKQSAETIAKRIASNTGKKRSPEFIAKMKAIVFSPEHKAKISASKTGKKHSAETRAKISAKKKGQIAWNKGKKGQIAWNKGKKGIYSPETRTKMSASRIGKIPWNKGKKGIYSAETRAKISASNTGKKHSAETRAKISANTPRFWQDKKLSPETRAKISAGNTGKKRSPEHRAKISAWQIGRKRSPETRAKLSAHRLHRVIPTKDTKLERKLQELLNTNNIQFTKHKPILGQPDIFIEPNICIFADGDYPHGWLYLQGKDYSKYRALNNEHFEKKIKKDQSVTTRLEAQGYKVLRLWEHEVYQEPKKCLDRIRALL